MLRKGLWRSLADASAICCDYGLVEETDKLFLIKDTEAKKECGCLGYSWAIIMEGGAVTNPFFNVIESIVFLKRLVDEGANSLSIVSSFVHINSTFFFLKKLTSLNYLTNL